MKAKPNLIHVWLAVGMLLAEADGSAQPVAGIIGGGFHSLFLKYDGSLWAMGDNGNGQLGDGTFSTNHPYYGTNQPEMIVSGNVTAIAAGEYHSLFLISDGSLWDMGSNPEGQLGDGTYNDRDRPEMIVASNVTAIAAGGYHSLFLTRDGSLWAFGDNAHGEAGDGTYSTNYFHSGLNQPEMIVASNVTAVAAGFYHTLFLKGDGSLWAVGWNQYGQLGDGTFSTNTPYYGTNRPEMILASNITAVAAGGGHSLFLKSNGSLWVTGWNAYGQLGDGTTNNMNTPEMLMASNITAIAAGYGFSLFLKNDGSLWAMGDNRYGQLGDGTYNNTNRPERIVAGGVAAISAGEFHSLFLMNDGSLWGMGQNLNGQLGNGHYAGAPYFGTNQIVQIVAGVPGYNVISGQLISGGGVRLTFNGLAGGNYALDRSNNLAPPNWEPQATNAADSTGVVTFTNVPDPATNNFWRIRSVP